MEGAQLSRRGFESLVDRIKLLQNGPHVLSGASISAFVLSDADNRSERERHGVSRVSKW
jgi:hypothetical protein